jgi:hypothetical protein
MAVHLSAEMLQRRLFTEGSARSEESNRQRLLKRAASGDDLREQTYDGSRRERPRVSILKSVDDLSLALGTIDRSPAFETADLACQLRALIYQPQDVIVDSIDAVTQLLERIGHGDQECAGK